MEPTQRSAESDPDQQPKRSKLFSEDTVPSTTFSRFELLPRDLMWKMIEETPESVLSLRQASKKAKASVDEFAMLRSTIPMVKEISVFRECRQPDLTTKARSCLRTQLKVLPHTTKLLRLRLLLRNPSVIADPTKSQVTGNSTLLMYNIWEGQTDIADLLRGSIGTRVGRVAVYCCAKGELCIVSKLIEGVKIRGLLVEAYTITNDIRDFLLTPIDAGFLSLSVTELVISDPVIMLILLSAKFKTIHVKQNDNNYIMKERRYFFGVHSINWTSVILEMFSGMLDALIIDNSSFPQYLNNADIDLLRQKLPELGKEILFKASCATYQDRLNYTVNEHYVRTGKLANSGCLEIIHSSIEYSKILQYL
ncbi:hypothetical protein PRIPAC_81444 [Pristionchus pacificus]|nr:hypothetical protein PRIPAC_81444 [Pristionchus pacificus]